MPTLGRAAQRGLPRGTQSELGRRRHRGPRTVTSAPTLPGKVSGSSRSGLANVNMVISPFLSGSQGGAGEGQCKREGSNVAVVVLKQVYLRILAVRLAGSGIDP
jgi:hypothetical protein